MGKRLGLLRRRAVEGGGAAAGFIASVIQAGVSILSRFTLLGGTADVGIMVTERHAIVPATQVPAFAMSLLGATGAVSVTQLPAISTQFAPAVISGLEHLPAFAVAQRPDVAWNGSPLLPGVDTDLLSATGSLAVIATNPAIAQTARVSDWKVAEVPAADIRQVTYSLVRRIGANAQAAVGTAWTTPANATGDHDAAVATVAGGALGSTNGIELAYANSVLKGELAITAAVLHVYAEVTGDATGLLSDTIISYNIGAGLVQLEAIAGNFANLVTPRDYSLPLLDTWAEYDALVARVVQTMAAASVGVTARLDAIEIEVTASRTDAL